MADVISHTSLFIPCNGNHHRNRNGGVSVFLSKSPICSSATRYPSLKAKLQKTTHSFHAPGHVRRSPRPSPPNAHVGIGIGRGQKWWEKGLKPNMREVSSAQDLVDSLLIAGDRLVVVDFFSPGCGGCKAVHPKICQLAEMNPDVQFLQVNYEEHKSMCYALNVHVLPFFRFYRGAHGRVCSFSCTNATIKKFKDALAKHTPDRCSLGPAKGLEEKELLALAACKDLSFTYKPLENQEQHQISSVTGKERDEILMAATQPSSLPLPLPLPLPIPSTTR